MRLRQILVASAGTKQSKLKDNIAGDSADTGSKHDTFVEVDIFFNKLDQREEV
jgi:hypothetical protein